VRPSARGFGEDLDAPIVSVGDKDASTTLHGYPTRLDEFTRIFTALTPIEQERAIGIELLDAIGGTVDDIDMDVAGNTDAQGTKNCPGPPPSVPHLPAKT
jgi:hypothetical protein